MKIKAVLSLFLVVSLFACSAKKSKQAMALQNYSIMKRSQGITSIIKGWVRGYDGRPAVEAKVESLGRGQGGQVLTDDRGYFELNVASGELQLDITSVDYGNVRTKPLALVPKEVVELNIILGAEEGIHKARQQNKSIDKAGTFFGEVGDFFLRIIDFFTPKSMPS